MPGQKTVTKFNSMSKFKPRPESRSGIRSIASSLLLHDNLLCHGTVTGSRVLGRADAAAVVHFKIFVASMLVSFGGGGQGQK
jgi:hypothetical protein